ncbi:Myosin phosphatase Rho-interacting protein, partial [Leptosomus discolor]
SSLPEEKSKTSSSFETGPKPSEKLDAEQAELDPEQKRSRARERRREGRSKTFDWAEFRPIQQALAQERANAADSSKSGSAAFPRDTGATDTDPGELERERARRREERSEEALRMEVDRILPVPADIKPQNVHVEIEQRWHQVETTPLREEKQIPIAPLHLAHAEERDEGLTKQHLTTLLEKELEQKQKEALELLEQNRHLQDQLKVALGREQSAREGYVLQATCERGFAAMEETHQKKIEDLHQRELEKLREEKDRLLAEETAATISAIEAMKNAHREELERELEKSQRSQISSVNADIEALRRQYLEELQSVQRELEVLSEQYSQKCLENAHLAQALEAERQALRQCQRENQELNAHNQELNNRLAAEITRLRTLLTGEGGGEAAGSPLTQGKDAYELEVLLRVKESEIQYLKQEISSLKDELQTALRDKKYASDKYKDIYTELSIVKAKADCDISRLKEQLKAATEAQGEKSPVNTTVSGYDIMKSKSNPDFLKKDRSSVSRQLRNIRSKSVIEQVSWDN